MEAKRTRTAFWLLAPVIVGGRLIPRRIRLLLARAIGAFAFRVLPRFRSAVVSNLERVAGTRGRAVRLGSRTFGNYAIYVADYVLFSTLGRRGVERLVDRADGFEHLSASHEGGHGTLLVTPHIGNWEMGGIWLSRRGYAVNVVSLADEDPRTEALRQGMRDAHGVRLLTYDPRSSSMEAMVGLLDALKRNEVVAMLTDRPSAGRTEEVPFLGGPVRLPIGAFILSWLSGASVVPCYCALEPNFRYRLVTDAPIVLDRSLPRNESIRRGVEEMGRRYESYIRAHPDQWYNFYPYWDATS